MAVGRLDVDSEGLLLLTTDGKLSHDIRSKKVEKEYFVQVDGLIDQTAINTMKAGVEIGIKRKKYLTDPCKASMIDDPPDFPVRTKRIRDERHGPTSWASIIITEGKYRQVRNMTAAVGFPTLRLIRVRIGDIHLADLNPGEVREVTDLSIA
jgi:23S rRNA pseudouridine2457 synthase